MTLKRILTAVLTTVSIPFLSSAQGTASGDVTVRSTPEGAHVTISGDVVVSGVTPARFRHLLIGNYKLVLKKHGYESYSSRVILDPTRQIEIDIQLSPKTQLKATVRSLFIPGWGQKYTDQKTKGFLFGALAIGSVLAYLTADDAENAQRVAIGSVIAVWGINLLDILFFYPEQRTTSSIKGLAVCPTANPDRVGLTLSKRF